MTPHHQAGIGDLRVSLREAVGSPVPLPGCGATAERFRYLSSLAEQDLQLARLVEAHLDAVAIAAELGFALVDPTATYGVWAAAGPTPPVATERHGRWTISGAMPWCGGAGIVDRALVVIPVDGIASLFDVANDRLVAIDDDPWTSDSYSESATGTRGFDQVPVAACGIGLDRGYLERPGFWHGAVGVAALWSGGIRGVVAAHRAVWKRTDPHARAHLGAAVAEARTAAAVLAVAAGEIDAEPGDVVAAQHRARWVRAAVDRAGRAAIEHLEIGAGPWPLTHDAALSRRTQDLRIALRQSHAERDLEPLGTAHSSDPG